MRVLFDAYWWSDGPMANRTVQRELIAAWADSFPGDELILAHRRGSDRSDSPGETVTTALWPHAVSNRLELARLARSTHADAVIAHNYAPLRTRSVVFIHDVMFEEHPEWFSPLERLYFSRMLPWSRSAAVVATSSQTEATRIERLRPSAAPVLATGLSVPTALDGATESRPPALADVDAFAVTVGRLNVRKNLESILEAAAVAQRVTPQTPLVVVGSTAHSGVDSEIPAAARRAIDDRRIVMLGTASDSELAWLYRHTALAITLSRDEGFGMPAVEAAHFGAPLLASDIRVFRETVGGYAGFVPLDATAQRTAEHIDRFWEARPTTLARDAIVERYSWRAAAYRLREAIMPQDEPA